MLEKSKKLDVELDASMKSCGERMGRLVSDDSADTARSANDTSAQMDVPIDDVLELIAL